MTTNARTFSLSGGAWCGLHRIDDYTAMLYSDEYRLMDGCAAKRKREFSTGRILARALLAKFGIKAGSIMQDQDKAPIWPKGISGSISHSGEVCFVVVSDSTSCTIGIDVQKITPLEDDLISIILTKKEQLACNGLRHIDRNLVANIIFSAKESVYKCLSHGFAPDLDFHDAVITLGSGSFTASIERMNLKMKGIYRIYNGCVFAGLLRTL